jgi:hypothetical protein
MPSSLKHWMHIIGGVLCLFGVGFVLIRLNNYAEQIDFTRFDVTAWVIIGLLTFVYGATNILLALAWWHLLAFFDVKVKKGWAIKAYGLSQLAKYVPGNILHLAGRQALGMAAGIPVRALVKSALWELGLISFAGVFFGFLALPLVWPELPVFVSCGIFGAMLISCAITLGRLFSPSVTAAFIWQIIFLALSGAVFMGTLALVAPPFVTFSTFFALCGAYVIAWLGGLVTPGSPAGVGVRELVLLFLLKGTVGEADLLLAVLLGRIVTVAGDFVFFSTASALKDKRGNCD